MTSDAVSRWSLTTSADARPARCRRAPRAAASRRGASPWPRPAATASKRRVHPGGELGAPAQHVGLAEAGAQVVAPGDALLQGGRVVGPGRLLDDLAGWRSPAAAGGRRPAPPARSTGNRKNAGHQVTPGDDPERAGRRSTVRIAIQPLCRSSVPTSWVSSSIRSSTSPTACSVSAESGWCMAASSRSARSRPSARSTVPAHRVRATVSSSAAPTTQSASTPTRSIGRVLGEPAGDQRAERGADRGDRAGDQRADARPAYAAAASRRCGPGWTGRTGRG